MSYDSHGRWRQDITADLKSVEASAWRQLDNKYISGDKFTASSDTIILYRIDEGNKRLYLQGTVAGSSSIDLVTIALTSIVKTVLTTSGIYLGYNNPSGYSNAYTYGGLSRTTEGISMQTTSEGKAVIIGSSYITYDELV